MKNYFKICHIFSSGVKDIEDPFMVRYIFEHKFIPLFLHVDPVFFIDRILAKENFLYGMINYLYSHSLTHNPYHVRQFSYNKAKLSDEIMMLKLNFPVPERMPLCYYSYVIFDKDFRKTRYYCIERDVDDSNTDVPFLCGWKNGIHLNYGSCTLFEDDIFSRCISLYTQEE